MLTHSVRGIGGEDTWKNNLGKNEIIGKRRSNQADVSTNKYYFTSKMGLA